MIESLGMVGKRTFTLFAATRNRRNSGLLFDSSNEKSSMIGTMLTFQITGNGLLNRPIKSKKTWISPVYMSPIYMFHPDLRLPASVVLLSKGMDESVDGYSAFDGMTEAGRTLADLLTKNGLDHLCIGGLATDYCVRATVLDALGRGLTVTVLLDGIAGVNLQPDDADPAIDEMRQVGARVLRVDELKVQ